MKKFIRPIGALFAVMIAASAFTVCAGAETGLSVPIRIEGIDGNIFYETVTVDDEDGTVTAADAFYFADKQSSDIDIKGAQEGYITEVNGIKAGKFGGYDGWYYCVNNEAPSVGVADYKLKDGDSLTLYYGGYPCQIPFAETDRLESDGVIVFKSNDEEYDENWNATKVVNPVKDAAVTVGGRSYTTDEKGEIKVELDGLTGDVAVQIEKKDESGAPCVLRFAPDYTIEFKNASADTDSETSDTDSEKNNDSDHDASSKTETVSSETSAASSQQPSYTAPAATAQTYTAPAAQTVTSQADIAPTGDSGKTRKALVVFGIAAGVVIIMIIIGIIMKTKKDEE